MRAPRQTTNGFTLIEVLVALSILAVGLAATSRATAWATEASQALAARQLADWVAQNQLAMMRASRKTPAPGQAQGVARQAGQDFIWTSDCQSLGQLPFRKVSLSVSDAAHPGTPLARLTAYLPTQP